MEGRGMKRIISLVLSCLLLFNSLSAVPLYASASEDTEYTELTFRDWGLEDQTATDGNNTVWCSQIPITTWENVAISGDISFGVNSTNSSWRFGTNKVKDGQWHGLSIRQDGNGNLVIEDVGDKVAALSWKSLGKYTAGTTIAIRVTFTKLETGDVELGVSVNNGDAVTFEITEEEIANLDLGMMIRASDGTSITIKSTAEPVIEYQELTFSDWGLEDQTATDGNNTVWCSQIPITTWENVAISGDISFGVNSTNSSWRFGTNKVKDGQWHGLSIRQDGNGNLIIEDVGDKVAALSWKSLGKYTVGETVAIRVTFTKLETGKVKLGVSVNNGEAVTIEITEEEIANLDLGMMVRASDGTAITIKSIVEPVIEYQELTFSDWGLEDQTATDGNNTVWCSEIPITSWENVAISGDISFGVNSTNSSWRFGTNKVKDGQWHGLSIRQDGSGNLVIEDVGDKVAALSWKSLGKYTAGETVAIRVTFTKLETGNVELGVSVNNGDAVTIEITEEEIANLDLGMMIRASDGTSITIKSIAREQEPEIEYQELTFSDWGLEDQTATDGNNTVWCSKIPITTWENVAISGDISFGVNSTNSSWRFGTNKVKDGQWHGLSIRQDGSGNLVIEDVGDKVAALSWKSLGKYTAGETVAIRVTFTKLETGNVELGVSINNGAPVIIEITEEEIINLDLGMMIRASDGTSITIKSIEREQEPGIEYTELTFRDWGLDDQTATDGNNTVWCSKIPITSWENVAISGDISFGVNSTNSSWRFGTNKVKDGQWHGLSIRQDGSGNLIIEDVGDKVAALSWKSLGKYTAGETVAIRVTFTKLETGNVELGVSINNGAPVIIEITEEEIINLDLGMMIRASDGTAVTIKSTPGTGSDDPTEKPEDKPVEPIGKPEDISGYDMITFKDFGISDRTVNGKTINSIKAVDLHGKVFKGKVTFPVGVTDSMNGILTFGGTPESEWLGLRLGASDNGLYMYEAANGANSWKISQDTFDMPEGIRGKEIEISLTFWCVDKKNVYVGMYVNDIFCGEKLYDNMENELGTRMMIYSSNADIKICSSDTPWMKFLKSDVKLEYFGFSTDNWREELDAICN